MGDWMDVCGTPPEVQKDEVCAILECFKNVVCRRIPQKYANFETMDKEKIDSVFKDFENRGLLKNDGFYTGDPVDTIIVASAFALLFVFILFVAILCLWTLDWHKIILSIFLGPFMYLILRGMWIAPSRLYWRRDRLVAKNFLGGNAHEYSYSDITLIKRHSEYDEGSKTYQMKIDISFRKRGMDTISIDDNPRAYEFFRSCFGDIFFDHMEDVREREYDLRLKFFARVLKRYTPKFHPYVNERQCAVRYFLNLKTYRVQGTEERYFTKRLNYWLRQFNRDEKEICVEHCRLFAQEIMNSKFMVYEERLEMLTYFFECTYVEDGLVDEWELELLSQIAVNLEIQSWDFVSLKHRFEAKKQEETKQKGKKDSRQQKRYQQVFSNRKQEAYSLLKLKENATLEEVKRAYRTQVKTCHPDTLPSTATIMEREEATVRFRSITEAYDFLCAELCAEPVSVAR